LTPDKQRFAYFITPHGYGHAARSAAVMDSIREMNPNVNFDIFTQVPVWFFDMSLHGGFTYHELRSDIGLVQNTSMSEDLPETVRQLSSFLPFRQEMIQSLALEVSKLNCGTVICDIAPLGIAVAEKIGLPSILVENFTWDWIYLGYLAEEPGFAPYIDLLNQSFQSAAWHIRTEPACTNEPPADLLTNVVSRKPRHSRLEIRNLLSVKQEAKMVMITMGGIVTEFPFMRKLAEMSDTLFLIPGGSTNFEKRGNLVLLPHHSDLYHPDLVGASDAVIGKLGYSTLAETYAAGIPYAYVARAKFREGVPMGLFARQVMGAVEIAEESFFDGKWIDLIPDLLSRPHHQTPAPNGAVQAARFILDR
jgi:hypothetical protein